MRGMLEDKLQQKKRNMAEQMREENLKLVNPNRAFK
jgi:hypothetical protein